MAAVIDAYVVQRQYDKANSVLSGAIPHASAIGKRFEAAVHMLMCSCQIDLALAGSSKYDTATLQRSLDAGIAALREDPPPAGGSSAAAAVASWAAEAKLEQWARILPMLRSLQIDGVDVAAAEAVLLPLADRFDLEVGETAENAEMFVENRMAPQDGGVLGNLNTMSMLFGLALLLPIALGVWLAVSTALAKDDLPVVGEE